MYVIETFIRIYLYIFFQWLCTSIDGTKYRPYILCKRTPQIHSTCTTWQYSEKGTQMNTR